MTIHLMTLRRLSILGTDYSDDFQNVITSYKCDGNEGQFTSDKETTWNYSRSKAEYVPGHAIEVDAMEARFLLEHYPSVFKPLDIIPPMPSLREQMQSLSGDEWFVLNILRCNKVILEQNAPVGSNTLHQMVKNGWLLRAEFADGSVVYKASPEVMSEFEQYEREQSN